MFHYVQNNRLNFEIADEGVGISAKHLETIFTPSGDFIMTLASAVILTLVLLGQVLELRAHSKTNSAIKALLGLVPPIARDIPPHPIMSHPSGHMPL